MSSFLFQFPKNINDEGIWYHLMDKFITLYKLNTDDKPEPETDETGGSPEEPVEEVTFELLEQRYHNYEPLLEKEYQRVR